MKTSNTNSEKNMQAATTLATDKKDEKLKLPTSWQEYCEQMEGKIAYVGEYSFKTVFAEPIFADQFDDEEDHKAFVFYSKLLKLRKRWVGNWKPDWTKNNIKFTIITDKNNIVNSMNRTVSRSMSFPTKEIRNEFADTFKDLLEKAKRFL